MGQKYPRLPRKFKNDSSQSKQQLGKVRKNEAQTENFHQISNMSIQFLGGIV
jgi:hypothetical protein